MQYNDYKRVFTFYYPNEKVSLRLNPNMVENKTLLVRYDGAIRQCKVLASRIEPENKYSNRWDFIQYITLNIAGVGVRNVRFTKGDIHELGQIRYAVDAEFFESWEDFIKDIHCNNKMFHTDEVWEFAEAILGDGVEFHYTEGTFSRCGSVAPATRYRWDGTKAVKFDVEIPNTMTFTPDGGINFGSSKDYINDLWENTYLYKEDCEEDNEVKVVKFDNEPDAPKPDDSDLKARLNEWLKEQQVSLEQLRDIINN